ncbi:hypothetical protein N2152v2_003148 [Parachlorella kessleri]
MSSTWEVEPPSPHTHQPAAVETAEPPAAAAANGFQPGQAVPVEFEVACEVPFGDSVRLCGDAAELGAWDPEAGLTLEWSDGHKWAASTQLPAVEVRFKVVVVKQAGGVEWEQGPDRCVELPVLSPLLASCGALRVSCCRGDACGTLVQLVGDKAKLQAAVSAAAERAAVLSRRREQMLARIRSLEAQVEESGVQLHLLTRRVQEAVEPEQEQHAQQKQRQQQQQPVLAGVGVGASSSSREDQSSEGRPRAGAGSPGGSFSAGGAGLSELSAAEHVRAEGAPADMYSCHTASGEQHLPWYLLSSVWESGSSLDEDGQEGGGVEGAAGASGGHRPGRHMHIVEGPIRPAITPHMLGLEEPPAPPVAAEPAAEAAAAAIESPPETNADTAEGRAEPQDSMAAAEEAAQPEVEAPAAEEGSSVQPSGAAGADGATEAVREERPEFPGCLSLETAADGTLIFHFEKEAATPSAAQLALKHSLPQLPEEATAALNKRYPTLRPARLAGTSPTISNLGGGGSALFVDLPPEEEGGPPSKQPAVALDPFAETQPAPAPAPAAAGEGGRQQPGGVPLTDPLARWEVPAAAAAASEGRQPERQPGAHAGDDMVVSTPPLGHPMPESRGAAPGEPAGAAGMEEVGAAGVGWPSPTAPAPELPQAEQLAAVVQAVQAVQAAGAGMSAAAAGRQPGSPQAAGTALGGVPGGVVKPTGQPLGSLGNAASQAEGQELLEGTELEAAAPPGGETGSPAAGIGRREDSWEKQASLPGIVLIIVLQSAWKLLARVWCVLRSVFPRPARWIVDVGYWGAVALLALLLFR